MNLIALKIITRLKKMNQKLVHLKIYVKFVQ